MKLNMKIWLSVYRAISLLFIYSILLSVEDSEGSISGVLLIMFLSIMSTIEIKMEE